MSEIRVLVIQTLAISLMDTGNLSSGFFYICSIPRFSLAKQIITRGLQKTVIIKTTHSVFT